METSRNGTHRGLVAWADEDLAPRPTNGKAAREPAPATEQRDAALERAAEAERRAALAEATCNLLRGEVERAELACRRAQVELDAERATREQADQARQAAESRLAEAREAVWRWLTRLARTPFWRLRRALAEPPVELQGQPRLAPPSRPEA